MNRRIDPAFRDRVAETLNQCSFANCEATDQLTPVARWGTRYCPDHIENARVFLDRLNTLADLHRSTRPEPAPPIEPPAVPEPAVDRQLQLETEATR